MRKRLDAEERREQILMAALQVFAEKGFSEASNRDIAAAAGLGSPGLIYHYFQSKLDLLRAIVNHFSPAGNFEERREWLLEQPPQIGLTTLGSAFLELHSSPLSQPLVKIVLGEALKNPEFADATAQVGPLRMLGIIKDYLEVQMDRGLLRRTDPETAARCFIGPFVTLLLYRVLWAPEFELPAKPDEIVRRNVDIFLNGARP